MNEKTNHRVMVYKLDNDTKISNSISSKLVTTNRTLN